MIADIKERIRGLEPNCLCFRKLQTLQVNLGNMCNQHCKHCHVSASPAGSKIMSKQVMKRIIDFLQNQEGLVLDITGGSPELHPNFRFFIEKTRKLTPRLMVRTNLTVLFETGMDWIPQWYRDHEVVLIASLPCYTRENVDKQRGKGVFEKSVKALRKLNELGYGECLELNLVHNPGGDFLPAHQRELEIEYRRQLLNNHGVIFNSLFTIANAPLGRFKDCLRANGRLESYIRLLADNFNPDTASNIMCQILISVDWQGVLYNCDFNLAAGLPIRDRAGRTLEIDRVREAISGMYETVLAEHCYSCTAGSGSSCTGVLIQ